jgi:hypothetical protein
MRVLVLLVLIVYCIGVGVELAPTIRSGWNHVSASDLAANVSHALPEALAWPAQVYRSLAGGDTPAAKAP